MPYEIINKRGMTDVQRNALLTLHGYSGACIPVEKQPFTDKHAWRRLGVSIQQVKVLEQLGYLEVNRDWSLRLTADGFANVRKLIAVSK